MDDAIGVHVVRRMRQQGMLGDADDVEYVDVGTAALDAYDIWERADLILAVDAMHGGEAPGSLYLMPVQPHAGGGMARGGLHELGLRDALSLCRRRSWRAVWVVGIEPQSLALGMELSPLLTSHLPVFVQRVTRIARLLRLFASCPRSDFPGDQRSERGAVGEQG